MFDFFRLYIFTYEMASLALICTYLDLHLTRWSTYLTYLEDAGLWSCCHDLLVTYRACICQCPTRLIDSISDGFTDADPYHYFDSSRIVSGCCRLQRLVVKERLVLKVVSRPCPFLPFGMRCWGRHSSMPSACGMVPWGGHISNDPLKIKG